MANSVSNIPPLFCFSNPHGQQEQGEMTGVSCFTRKSNSNVTIISETRLEELRAQEDLRRKRLARKAELARISRKQKREKMQNLESENVRLKSQLTQLTSLASLTCLTQDSNCKCHSNIENCLKQSNYSQMMHFVDKHKRCLHDKLTSLQNMSQAPNLSQTIQEWHNQINTSTNASNTSNTKNVSNVTMDNMGDTNGPQNSMAALLIKYQNLTQHESKLFASLSNVIQDKYTVLSQICTQKRIKVEKC